MERDLPWGVVRDHVNLAIQQRKDRLCDPTMEAANTQFVRGEIRALKFVLSLPELIRRQAEKEAALDASLK